MLYYTCLQNYVLKFKTGSGKTLKRQLYSLVVFTHNNNILENLYILVVNVFVTLELFLWYLNDYVFYRLAFFKICYIFFYLKKALQAGVAKSEKCILVHGQLVVKKALVRTKALLARTQINTKFVNNDLMNALEILSC